MRKEKNRINISKYYTNFPPLFHISYMSRILNEYWKNYCKYIYLQYILESRSIFMRHYNLVFYRYEISKARTLHLVSYTRFWNSSVWYLRNHLESHRSMSGFDRHIAQASYSNSWTSSYLIRVDLRFRNARNARGSCTIASAHAHGSSPMNCCIYTYGLVVWHAWGLVATARPTRVVNAYRYGYILVCFDRDPSNRRESALFYQRNCAASLNPIRYIDAI